MKHLTFMLFGVLLTISIIDVRSRPMEGETSDGPQWENYIIKIDERIPGLKSALEPMEPGLRYFDVLVRLLTGLKTEVLENRHAQFVVWAIKSCLGNEDFRVNFETLQRIFTIFYQFPTYRKEKDIIPHLQPGLEDFLSSQGRNNANLIAGIISQLTVNLITCSSDQAQKAAEDIVKYLFASEISLPVLNIVTFNTRGPWERLYAEVNLEDILQKCMDYDD